MLLQSEHRTLDPEEADFFYLPVSQPTACMHVLPTICTIAAIQCCANCQCQQQQRQQLQL